jgi:DNA-binding transcriptional regulator/RsmH inhibitor MraZ
MAGLEAEAVVVGARDHAEIWAPVRWDVYRRSLEDSAALAEAIEGLGI